jgi:hypothetical protein
VGVYATHRIEAGDSLRIFLPRERVRWLRARELRHSPMRRFCVDFGGGWLACPTDFGRMSVGWYLNHSSTPNAEHRRYRYFAIRDIAAGEEITVDYRSLGV